MSRIISLIFVSFLFSNFSYASVRRTVHCSAEHEGKFYELAIKLEGLRIIPWSDFKWAKISSPRTSPFFWLGQNRQDSGIESETSSLTGSSSLKLTTTAESVKLSLKNSAEFGYSGLFQYRDLGSGNGNLRLELDCF